MARNGKSIDISVVKGIYDEMTDITQRLKKEIERYNSDSSIIVPPEESESPSLLNTVSNFFNPAAPKNEAYDRPVMGAQSNSPPSNSPPSVRGAINNSGYNLNSNLNESTPNFKIPKNAIKPVRPLSAKPLSTRPKNNMVYTGNENFNEYTSNSSSNSSSYNNNNNNNNNSYKGSNNNNSYKGSNNNNSNKGSNNNLYNYGSNNNSNKASNNSSSTKSSNSSGIRSGLMDEILAQVNASNSNGSNSTEFNNTLNPQRIAGKLYYVSGRGEAWNAVKKDGKWTLGAWAGMYKPSKGIIDRSYPEPNNVSTNENNSNGSRGGKRTRRRRVAHRKSRRN